MRYLAPRLRRDLQNKMILLAGPRQCGKTTLAKSLLDDRGQYLDWDIAKDRKVIRELAWPKDASLVVLIAIPDRYCVRPDARISGR